MAYIISAGGMKVGETGHLDHEPLPSQFVELQTPHSVVYHSEDVSLHVTMHSAEHVYIIVDFNTRVELPLYRVFFCTGL